MAAQDDPLYLRSPAPQGAALRRSRGRFVVPDALRPMTVTGAAPTASPWRPLLQFWLATLAVAVAGGAVLQRFGPPPRHERSRGEQVRPEPLRSAEPDGSKPAAAPARPDTAVPQTQPGSAGETASTPPVLGPSVPTPSGSASSVAIAKPPSTSSLTAYPRLIAAMDIVADPRPAPSVAAPQSDEQATTLLGPGERATARSEPGEQSPPSPAPVQAASDADPQGTGLNDLVLVTLHPTARSGDGKALAERLASQAGLAPDQIGAGPPGGSRSGAAVIRFYVAMDHALARRLGYGLGQLGYAWRIENRSGRPFPPGRQEAIEVWLPEL